MKENRCTSTKKKVAPSPERLAAAKTAKEFFRLMGRDSNGMEPDESKVFQRSLRQVKAFVAEVVLIRTRRKEMRRRKPLAVRCK